MQLFWRRKTVLLFAQTIDSSKVELLSAWEKKRSFFWITERFQQNLARKICKYQPKLQAQASTLTHGNHRNFHYIWNVHTTFRTIDQNLYRITEKFQQLSGWRWEWKKKWTTLQHAWNASKINEISFSLIKRRKKKQQPTGFLPATCVITNSFVECTSLYSFCRAPFFSLSLNLFAIPPKKKWKRKIYMQMVWNGQKKLLHSSEFVHIWWNRRCASFFFLSL